MEKLEKIIDLIMRNIMAFVMLVLTIFGTWQVFTRLILGHPSTYTEELLRYLLIWAGMIGAAYCFYKDRHIKLTLLTSKLGEKGSKLLYVITEMLVVIFVIYVYIYGGFQMVVQNATQLTAVLRISMSIVYACLPFAGVFILISKALVYMKALKNGGKN